MQRFDAQEVRKAEDLMTKFQHKAEEVVNFMFCDLEKIETHGDTFLSEDAKTVTHYFWDGYDAEPYDNCHVEFPFEWINMSYEELEAIKPKFVEDMRIRRQNALKEAVEKAEADYEAKQRAEYERLKKHFEEK